MTVEVNSRLCLMECNWHVDVLVAGVFSDNESSLVSESDQSPADPLPTELQTFRQQWNPISGERRVFVFICYLSK